MNYDREPPQSDLHFQRRCCCRPFNFCLLTNLFLSFDQICTLFWKFFYNRYIYFFDFVRFHLSLHLVSLILILIFHDLKSMNVEGVCYGHLSAIDGRLLSFSGLRGFELPLDLFFPLNWVCPVSILLILDL